MYTAKEQLRLAIKRQTATYEKRGGIVTYLPPEKQFPFPMVQPDLANVDKFGIIRIDNTFPYRH